MTIEQLQERRKKLADQREQVIANINAIDGAIQVMDGLIRDWDKPEPDPIEAAR